MHPLNLPSFAFRLRESAGRKQEIFDPVRRKFVTLTPEEWVRQHMLNYLTVHLHYPASLIGVEIPLHYHTLKKRSDIVAFDRTGAPLLVVECKAPAVELTREVLYQVAMYNHALAGRYVVLTNGIVHYVCRMGTGGGDWSFLQEIPDFNQIGQ